MPEALVAPMPMAPTLRRAAFAPDADADADADGAGGIDADQRADADGLPRRTDADWRAERLRVRPTPMALVASMPADADWRAISAEPSLPSAYGVRRLSAALVASGGIDADGADWRADGADGIDADADWRADASGRR